MACYKIEKLGIVRYLNFVDLTSAQAYADSLGTGYVASLQDVQDYPPINISEEDKAVQDKYFLLGLVSNFVVENRESGTLTLAQDLALLSAFNNIKQLAEVGAVDATRELLIGLTGLPIAGVYTELRREKDILRIDSYTDTL
jgi:hypothetical protein